MRMLREPLLRLGQFDALAVERLELGPLTLVCQSSQGDIGRVTVGGSGIASLVVVVDVASVKEDDVQGPGPRCDAERSARERDVPRVREPHELQAVAGKMASLSM